MNTDQDNICEMQIGVGAYMLKNALAWNGNKAITEVVKQLDENNAAITQKRGVQETVLEGQTDLKKTAKEALINEIIDIADPLNAYAHSAKDVVLADQTEVSATGLRRLPGELLVEKASEISKLATANVAELVDYNITQVQITVLDDAIEEFKKDKTAPAVARATRRAETRTLPVLIHDNEILLKKQLDKLVTPFRRTNAPFHAGYLGARVIIDRRAHRKAGEPTPTPPPPTP